MEIEDDVTTPHKDKSFTNSKLQLNVDFVWSPHITTNDFQKWKVIYVIFF